MIALTILVLFSFLIGLRLRKNEDLASNNILDKDTTTCVRGIMAILIVCCHLYRPGMPVWSIFQYAWPCVAVFFFFSGWGLMRQYKNRGREYLNGIWRNKVVYLLLLFLLTNIAAIVFSLPARNFDLYYTLGHFRLGSTWYLISQMILYIFFVTSYIMCPQGGWKAYLLLSCLITIPTFILYYMNVPYHWYCYNLPFVLGVVLADTKFLDTIVKNKFLSLLICSLLALLLCAIAIKFPQIKYMVRIFLSIIVVLLLISFLTIFKFNGSVWKYLGNISLEIYLVHGFVFVFSLNKIQNDVLFIIASLIFTILASIPVHHMNIWISKQIKR